MKLTALSLMLSLSAFAANADAQQVSVTVSNAKVKTVLNSISDQTGLSLAYSAQVVDLNRKVSLNFVNTEVSEVLNAMFGNTAIGYEIKDGKIYLFKAAEKTTALANQQKKIITGTVVDPNGEAVIGANVLVKGTTNGTITDMDGKFSLEVPEGAMLLVSYIGYGDYETKVDNQSNLSITLKEDSQALDELVVVGYGVQKKVNLTGSVSSVKGEELSQRPVANATQSLQGLVPGLVVSNSNSGRPGATSSLTLRGQGNLANNANPYVLVDGVEMDLADVNPNDIESISVLKDAAAASIYGARAAYGVILVTTKKGKEGKVTLNYSGTVTFETLHDVTEMMSAAEWLDYARLAKYNAGSYASATPTYEADKAAFGSVTASWKNIEKAWVNGVYDPSLVGSYDWASHGKQTGITHEHTLSASGGSDKFQGYASFGYLDQKGTQPGQAYERYTLKTSFDVTPVNWFKMGSSINASYSTQDYGYSFSKSVTGSGDFYSALRSMIPWTVPYDENGEYVRYPSGDVNIINPIRELDYNTNQRRTFRASASLYSQIDFGKIWKPLEGLSYRLQFGPEFQFYTLGVANAADGINGDGNNGAQYKNEQKRAWTLDNLIYYNKALGQHNLGMTLMQSASAYHYEMGDMRATNVASSDELWYNIGSAGTLNSFGTGLTETQMASYMIRLNYGYKDKYLLTASMRWDGASQLAEGHKWASFPSVAAAWRISDEAFMKNVEALSNLKLRLSWGKTGNSGIMAYGTQSGLTPKTNSAFQDNGYTYYIYNEYVGNENVGWEMSNTWDLGFDIGLFNNRISAVVDLYQTKTTDILLPRTLPTSMGGSNATPFKMYQNIGATMNRGIEVSVNTVNVDNKNFKWNSTLTFAANHEEITDLIDGKDIIGAESSITSSLLIGRPLRSYHYFINQGIWQENEAEEAAKYFKDAKKTQSFKPGDIKLQDLDGNFIIDDNDRTYLGSQSPKWTGGLNNNFSYKNFDLNVYIIARWGQMIDYELAGAYDPQGKGNFPAYLNYWTPENPSNDFPRPAQTNFYNYLGYESLNYIDGSYWKIKTVSLGYTFPKSLTSKLGVSKLRAYVTANNLFSFAKNHLIQDYDAERGGSAKAPLQRQFIFGLNLDF